ncbi:cell envelope biogenesis protein OmpA [Hymenobacter sp. UV11]|uniref:OmpA family protein n=1 Tax=Hymenobacter sp. UV11 TaxID=1849735 RepID=UPI00105FB527|nr:OmpA family protein [Hymenobacter sp. UV11]TFZ65380.1 cell envelope biogenesis protein OmpA [Hymenobacter sp. UV11]
MTYFENKLGNILPTLLLATGLLTLPGCNKKEIAALQQQNADLSRSRDELTKSRDQLQAEKSALLQSSTRTQASLSADLMNKSNQVSQLNQALGTTEQDLAAKNARVAELQRVLDEKDAATKALRQKVSDALLGFNSKDLQVNVKNGKVYVSLSEQLLFKSGATKVDPAGQDALVKLANALTGNKDVNILVEGHTDNVPIKGVVNGAKDNWDLSVLRATEITRLLTAAGIDPTQITPSGRGQYLPVAANDTPQDKALNRRTDIILTPKLDELFSILNTQ